MGPLELLFQRLALAQDMDMGPREQHPRQFMDMQNMFAPSPGRQPMPMRPPGQGGPMPPTGGDGSEDVLFYPGSNTVEAPAQRGPLARMFGGSPRG